MDNIEISKIIDGKEVKAITTFATLGEFRIRLVDLEFHGSLCSPHIMAMALQYRRYIDLDGTFTDYGKELAFKYIELLWEARKRFIPCKKECQIASEEIFKLVISNNSKIEIEKENILRNRREQKAAFKSGEMNLIQYKKKLKIIKDELYNLNDKMINFTEQTINSYITKIDGLLKEESIDYQYLNESIFQHFIFMLNQNLKIKIKII